MRAGPVATRRCAIYTRVSTDQGLAQDFNSLDAQHEAASAYITSQAHAGWTLIRARYDDGGYSGGSTDRPNLQRLLQDVRDRKIDIIVVYKVDRLTDHWPTSPSWSSCSMPMTSASSRSPSSSTRRRRWVV